MGVRVIGVGIEVIRIEGVKELIVIEYFIILDCIEVGIFMIVVVIIGGNVLIEDVVFEYISLLIVKFEEMGV